MTVIGNSSRLGGAHIDGNGSALGSEPFWTNLKDHRIIVQECTNCGHCWLPLVPACPYCGHTSPSSKALSGKGTVYSWTRVHRTRNPHFSEDVPYVIGTIEIATLCRTFARLEGAKSPEIGQPVTPLFLDHDGWTELRFRTGTLTSPCLEG